MDEPPKHTIETLLASLESENQSLRAKLQASEGLEATHEQLTAAHEEMLAINEELRSANGKLLGATEELQRVKGELNDKIVELGKVNDDLANFLDSAPVVTVFLDRNLDVRRFSPSASNLMNLQSSDLGRPIASFSSCFFDTDLAAIAGGVSDGLMQTEKEIRAKDGSWHMLRSVAYRTAQGLEDGAVLTFTDVTRLKRAEEEIMAARDYAENIIHTTREPLLMLDGQLRVVSANPAFYETFQVAPEETEKRLIYELGNNQWNIPKLRLSLEQILRTHSQVENFEVKHDFAKIGPKFISLNARRIDNRANTDVQLILLGIADVTDGEARARLAAVVESSEDAIIGKNLDGIITSWNAAAERLFGYSAEEMIGQSILRIIPKGRDTEEEKTILERLRRGERVEHFETVRVRKDRQLINVSLTISPIKDARGNVVGASKIARDITERTRIEQQRRELSRELEKQVVARTAELRQANRKLLEDMDERRRLEEQLRQSQRLESMGILAAGVAHDLNNLLNIIQGYASVLGPDASRDEISESVDAITETTKRGAGLVQQLLTLARKTEITTETIDVNALIQGLTTLIKGTFPKSIETKLDLAPNQLSILADANQISQVVLNLCVNARDAMPEGGSLTLKTSTVDSKALEMHGAARSGDYAVIAITDTGTGMDENVRSRIFEPFFTTKQIGQGTGLGLAVAYGIVQSHNGLIQVESEPMRGTTFRLYFPATRAEG